jgi:hypothetical protein
VWKYLAEFNRLKPMMYHLTDLYDISSEFDLHKHIGKGQLNIARALLFVAGESMIKVETEKTVNRI